jgi:1,4-alpha-glucan branching enzyme
MTEHATREGKDTYPLALRSRVCDFTPVPGPNYRLGAPRGVQWREALNSDASCYGGGGWGNFGGAEPAPVTAHGRPHSLTLTLPPLGALVLTSDAAAA